jgi:hypothetical protein
MSVTAFVATDRGIGAFRTRFTGGAIVVDGGVVKGADGTFDCGVLFTEGGVVPKLLAHVVLGEFGGFRIQGETAKAVEEGEEGATKSF